MRMLIAGMALVTLVSGCSTYAIPNYAISADTVATLRTVVPTKIALGPFRSSNDIAGDITCRAVGPVKTPDGEPFAQYIRNALRSELIIADRYDDRAPLSLTGDLDTFMFDSNAGLWTVGITILSTNGKTFRTLHTHRYTSSFYGETGCNQTAQAGMAAVQKTISAIVRNPQFPGLVR